MINSSHTLVKLAKVVDRDKLTATFDKTFCTEKGMPTISMQLMGAFIALNTR
jgi:hypothetical protein